MGTRRVNVLIFTLEKTADTLAAKLRTSMGYGSGAGLRRLQGTTGAQRDLDPWAREVFSSRLLLTRRYVHYYFMLSP